MPHNTPRVNTPLADDPGINIRIPGPTPTWSSLSIQERQLLDAYLTDDTYGRRIRMAAGADDDFAVWLTAACAEFHRLCGYRPVDPATRHFRRRYIEGRTPVAAAKLDLHLRPMVVITDGELQCPLCDALDTVCHEDIALRRVPLHVDGNAIYAENTPRNLRNGTYHCTSCDTTLQLPRPVHSCLPGAERDHGVSSQTNSATHGAP